MKKLKYQQKAVDELVNKTIDLLGLHGTRHTLVFKAPTGSGKTVMASEMLARLCTELAERPDAPCTQVAFIWVAPNKLHQQSYFKMKSDFSDNPVLRPVFFDGIDRSAHGHLNPGEILFINWESVNKDSNLLVRDTETADSLYDIVRRTTDDNGIPIVLIIDEEHMFGGQNARKSELVVDSIQPKVEIRISATPQTMGDEQVNIPRQKVIEEEMIKEGIVLNPALDFGKTGRTLNQQLIDQALNKRAELAEAYRSVGSDVNPLLLIQLPNDTDDTMSAEDTKIKNEVIATLADYGITTANGRLAIWLSGEKTDNLDLIDRNDDMTEVLLFKQAIALGWDCPRAAVLIIFRKIESFPFSAQTVGRILRMPEQRFYTDERLNRGYVYTNLSQDIISVVKDDMDYMSTDVVARLRDGIDNITLDSEYSERPSAMRNRIGVGFREALREAFRAEWGLETADTPAFTEDMMYADTPAGDETADLDSLKARNRESAVGRQGVDLDVREIGVDVIKDLDMTGESIARSHARYINNIEDLTAMYLSLCRQLLGNGYEQVSVRPLGAAVKDVMAELFGLSEEAVMTVMLSNDPGHENRAKFSHVIGRALDSYSQTLSDRQAQSAGRLFRSYTWSIPDTRSYPTGTYTACDGYANHALQPFVQYNRASDPERDFARYLSDHPRTVDWWYKNGDSGKSNFAISYVNSRGIMSLFYVDFIIRMKNGDIYLFDTKTKNSDPEAPYKHNALRAYTERPENRARHIRGGILIRDNHGNWLYPDRDLDPAAGTDDISDYRPFNPHI